MKPLERWRPIPGWGEYAVSSEGRVYSWRLARYVGTLDITQNRRVVDLWRANNHRRRGVAKLVLETFSPTTQQRVMPFFKDGNRENCALANLRWGTRYEISQQASEVNPIIHKRSVCPAQRCFNAVVPDSYFREEEE